MSTSNLPPERRSEIASNAVAARTTWSQPGPQAEMRLRGVSALQALTAQHLQQRQSPLGPAQMHPPGEYIEPPPAQASPGNPLVPSGPESSP